MRVLEETEIKLEWTDILNRVKHPAPEPYETEGIHVSSIIRSLALQNGRWKEDEERDEMPFVVAIGIAMEEWLAGLYADMWWQPGALRREGLVGHPDGYSTYVNSAELGELVVDEFKATYKSRRKRRNILDEWTWIQQPLSYMNMHEIRPRLFQLHICWMVDDYTYPLHPTYIRYLIEASQQDLDENWRMMTKHKLLPAQMAAERVRTQ